MGRPGCSVEHGTTRLIKEIPPGSPSPDLPAEWTGKIYSLFPRFSAATGTIFPNKPFCSSFGPAVK